MTYFMAGPTDEERDQEDQINRQEEPEPRKYSDEAEEGAPQPAEDDAVEEPDTSNDDDDEDDDDGDNPKE